jgi:hypothetical protein
MSKQEVSNPEEILADAIRVYKKAGSFTRDGYRTLGNFSEKAVIRYFGSFVNLRDKVMPPEVQSAKPYETREFGKNSGVVATVNNNVRTLDELLEYMQVDLSVWEVEKHTINKWEVAMREPATTVGGAGDEATVVENENGGQHTLWTRGSSTPLHEPLYQVKAWLTRREPTVKDVAFERILDRVEALSKVPKAVSYPKRESKTLLEVSLYDAHFGLLAWGKETGENYDLKIAERRYSASVTDLLSKVKGWMPERIILPVGNDFFHVNNPEGMTPLNRNVLDTDGRLCKIVEAGEAALITAVSTCLKVAPVQVLWIPGNHDPETSYFMCRVLKAMFHANKNVVVDISPAPRKYVHYGCNLIGFTHGNEERHHDLPTIMASEQKHVWGKVTHREWHIGHYHKKKETRYSAGDTFGGVAVKIIPSICGTDAWHFRKGYVGNDRVAEAFLYDHEAGLIGTFTSKDVRHIGS